MPAELTGEERESAERERIDEWQEIYSDEYEQISTAVFTEDFAGWDSSYDGRPIPLEHMREWREQTVARIRELHPRRILEIGVGSGLLLSRLAPEAEAYWATDFAAPVIRKIGEDLRRDPELAAKVELRCRPAHVTDGLPTGYFDTIVINSVIQYFPSIDHLTEVIRGAMDLLAPGGALFVGDVRNLRQARAFHTGIQLTRAGEDADPEHVRRAVERNLALEKELLVDPDYFTTLGFGVDLRTKRGHHHNELTRYRYDAVLYHGEADVRLGDEPVLDWADGQIRSGEPAPGRIDGPVSVSADGSVPEGTGEPVWAGGLARHLRERRPERLRVTGVPDARAASERGAATTGGVEPEALHELGAREGYRLLTTWSREPGATTPSSYGESSGSPRASTRREEARPRTPTPRRRRAARAVSSGGSGRTCGSSCPTTWSRPPSSPSTGCP